MSEERPLQLTAARRSGWWSDARGHHRKGWETDSGRVRRVTVAGSAGWGSALAELGLLSRRLLLLAGLGWFSSLAPRHFNEV
mmetsp:Transcript_150809/g.420360  ORF Transcript_150809/g.420360 Transcript_150809/m.420360 type:complete len:82 (-) Transcript_150809:193-438(-)